MVSVLEVVEGVGVAATVPLACKGKPMQLTKKPILYKYRIIYVKLLSGSKIHAMNPIEIMRSKTLAYKDTFRKKVPAQGLILGNRLKKAGCQEHVSQLARLPAK